LLGDRTLSELPAANRRARAPEAGTVVQPALGTRSDYSALPATAVVEETPLTIEAVLQPDQDGRQNKQSQPPEQVSDRLQVATHGRPAESLVALTIKEEIDEQPTGPLAR